MSRRRSSIPAAKLLQTSLHEYKNWKRSLARSGSWYHDTRLQNCRRLMRLFCAAKMAFGNVFFSFQLLLPPPQAKHFEGWTRRPTDHKLMVNNLFTVRRLASLCLYAVLIIWSDSPTIYRHSCISYSFCSMYTANREILRASGPTMLGICFSFWQHVTICSQEINARTNW